jgi:ornithine cyclodeaminase
MGFVVLTHAQVEALLPMNECIDVMSDALAALARGEVQNPLRFVTRSLDGGSFMGLMPAHRAGAEPVWALKAICVLPDNPRRGLDAHQGAVVLFDGQTGEIRAVMNASAVTAIRTAAVSAVATRLLAREDARELAILGAGVQARWHLEAMRAVRRFDRVRISSRTLARAEALAREAGAEAVASAEDAVRGADVVVTATSSPAPVLQRGWLKAGAHVNAVGASIRTARELDTRTVADAALFVDRRESTVNEAGDYLIPLAEGAIPGVEHIRAEIGELVLGAREGRRSDDELTVFKSLGLAVEDLAAAEHVLLRAEESGAGTRVGF